MSKISELDIEYVKQAAAESTSMREFQLKLGYSQNGSVSSVIRAFCKEHNISLTHFTGLGKGAIKRSEENIFIENSTASQKVLREWYKKANYSPYICAICGQEPFWNGKELTLTLDHINGVNNDDRLENLRWVCPNCDRQLDTFGSKNNHNPRVNAAKKKKESGSSTREEKNNRCQNCGKLISDGATLCVECRGLSQRKVQNRPSAEELEKILYNNRGNFTKVASMFGVTDNAIRKWCKAYNMPFHSSDYKNKK